MTGRRGTKGDRLRVRPGEEGGKGGGRERYEFKNSRI